MIKIIRSGLNNFTGKMLRLSCYNRPSLSRDHQTVTIMNHCCSLLFDGFWKVKAKHVLLCLNTLAKLHKTRGASRRLAMMGNWLTCSHKPWSYNSSE